MKINKRIIFFVLFLIVFVLTMKVTAGDVKMIYDINNIEFKPGDTVTINITLINNENYPLIGSLISNIKGGNTEFSYYQNLDISAKSQKSYNAYSIKIDNLSKSGERIVMISILNNQNEIISTEKFAFSISGTLKPFEISLAICKDLACTEKSKVFIQNEDVYLDYTSGVSEPIINATLTYPDNTTQQVILPTSIKAEQIGTYELEITATKEGYKTITKKEQFGVIEQGAEIESAEICNANDVCESGETIQNCPQDCTVAEEREPIKLKGILIFGGIILILFLILIWIIYLITKRNRKSNFKENQSMVSSS